MVRLEMSRPGQMAPAVETTALAFPDRARMPNAAVLLITCQNLIEHPELICQRLGRFIDIVGMDRVIASTDCGFGTFAGYGKIDPGVTWKKLTNLRRGADLAEKTYR